MRAQSFHFHAMFYVICKIIIIYLFSVVCKKPSLNSKLLLRVKRIVHNYQKTCSRIKYELVISGKIKSSYLEPSSNQEEQPPTVCRLWNLTSYTAYLPQCSGPPKPQARMPPLDCSDLRCASFSAQARILPCLFNTKILNHGIQFVLLLAQPVSALLTLRERHVDFLSDFLFCASSFDCQGVSGKTTTPSFP